MSLKSFNSLLFFCVLGQNCLGTTIDGYVTIPTESIRISEPPIFVIADYGFRHDLRATYRSIYIPVGEEYEYQYQYTPLTEVPGMVIGGDGVVQFLPSPAQTGITYTMNVEISASRDGSEIFSDTLSFMTMVIAEPPEFALWDSFRNYVNARIRYGFNLDFGFPELNWPDEPLQFFRFYLIDPPSGVHLVDRYGNPEIAYPDTEFGDGITQIPVRLKYDLETIVGTVSREIEFVQEVLPEAPPTGILNIWNRAGIGYGAFFGFSLASDGEWLVTGEPFIGDTDPVAPSGRVRVWKIDTQTGDLLAEAVLDGTPAYSGEAFGASVAVRDMAGDLPPAIVVGVPEAFGGQLESESNVGRIDVFELSVDGIWEPVARLAIPDVTANLFTGGWVEISGDTLIGSVEGADSEGANTGLLAVFKRDADDGSWKWLQSIAAPNADEGDFFSYPCAIVGDWLAAAANEDDEAGLNAGAVHLYQYNGEQFIHRQKLLSPEPEPGALFGERLELNGEWLFVSSFRQTNSTGAVYAYKLNEGLWEYHQRLEAPFAKEYSGFGSALALNGDTLCISAPGQLSGPSNYPWTGLTLYRLKAGVWEWSNHCPGVNFEDDEAFGFSLAQITSQRTVAGLPFENLNQGRTAGGRIVRIDWPLTTPESFESATEQFSPTALAGGDEDDNGVPNIIQWAMGHDIGQDDYVWRTFTAASRPSLNFEEGKIKYIIPPITRGWNLEVDLMLSTDGVNWTKVTGAEWEQVKSYTFTSESALGTYLGPMQPIVVPALENYGTTLLRLQIRQPVR